MSQIRRPDDPWYTEGLAFSCTRCGACCTGAPGYVWVDAAQIERLAGALDLDPAEFSRNYVRRVGPRYSLVERPGGDCIFWDSRLGCTVYESRPIQCRTWPFWQRNVATPAEWEATCRVCPGSGKGRVYSVEEIASALEGRAP